MNTLKSRDPTNYSYLNEILNNVSRKFFDVNHDTWPDIKERATWKHKSKGTFVLHKVFSFFLVVVHAFIFLIYLLLKISTSFLSPTPPPLQSKEQSGFPTL